MKSNLSAWKYVKNNRKNVTTMVVGLALSFAAIYIVHMLLMTSVESFKPLALTQPKKMCFFALSRSTLDQAAVPGAEDGTAEEKRDALVKLLEQTDGIDSVIRTQIIRTDYRAVIGTLSMKFPLYEAKDIPAFLRHVDAKLTDGRMPEEDGEILVDEVILKNMNAKIGDWYLPDWYGEVFKIVGTIKSEGMYCVGTPKGFVNNGWYNTVLCDGEHSDLESLLAQYGIKLGAEDEIDDAVTNRTFYQRDCVELIENVVKAISAIVMFFLGVTMLIAYVSFLRNRVNEYCLYTSIGYSRFEVYGMMMREMLLIFVSGLVAGILTAIPVCLIFRLTIIDPRGMICRLLYPDKMLQTAGLMLFILGIIQIPLLLCIRGIKTIDRLED
ncbi:MAG: ABC transporter permease [Lachnospiraceae bacterium]|nr:ABC transporter permease [Lachnospiraceae bacterium]MBR5666891.1 ABC transporter permease [Lachnospiraceae bacterium]